MDELPPTTEDASPGATLTPAQIAAAFQGGAPKTRVSIFYQLGLIIVAVS